MAEQQRDVIEILEHDHREVEQMFTELESLRGASTEEEKSRRKTLTGGIAFRPDARPRDGARQGRLSAASESAMMPAVAYDEDLASAWRSANRVRRLGAAWM